MLNVKLLVATLVVVSVLGGGLFWLHGVRQQQLRESLLERAEQFANDGNPGRAMFYQGLWLQSGDGRLVTEAQATTSQAARELRDDWLAQQLKLIEYGEAQAGPDLLPESLRELYNEAIGQLKDRAESEEPGDNDWASKLTDVRLRLADRLVRARIAGYMLEAIGHARDATYAVVSAYEAPELLDDWKGLQDSIWKPQALTASAEAADGESAEPATIPSASDRLREQLAKSLSIWARADLGRIDFGISAQRSEALARRLELPMPESTDAAMAQASNDDDGQDSDEQADLLNTAVNPLIACQLNPADIDLHRAVAAALRSNDVTLPEALELRTLFGVGNGDALADALVDRAVTANGGDPDALLKRAAYLEAIGQREAAGEDVQAALRLAPKNAIANHAEGRRLAQAGSYDKAVAFYRIAIDSDPEREVAYVALAEALWAQGKRADAVAELKAAKEALPTSALDVQFKLVDYLLDRHQYDGADLRDAMGTLNDLDGVTASLIPQVRSFDPDRARLVRNRNDSLHGRLQLALGRADRSQGRTVEADKHFESAQARFTRVAGVGQEADELTANEKLRCSALVDLAAAIMSKSSPTTADLSDAIRHLQTAAGRFDKWAFDTAQDGDDETARSFTILHDIAVGRAANLLLQSGDVGKAKEALSDLRNGFLTPDPELGLARDNPELDQLVFSILRVKLREQIQKNRSERSWDDLDNALALALARFAERDANEESDAALLIVLNLQAERHLTASSSPSEAVSGSMSKYEERFADNAGYWGLRGDALIKAGDAKAAATAYSRQAELSDAVGTQVIANALALRANGKLEEAIEALGAAIGQDDTDKTTQRALSKPLLQMLLQTGRIEEALQVQEDLDPDNENPESIRAKHQLALLLEDANMARGLEAQFGKYLARTILEDKSRDRETLEFESQLGSLAEFDGEPTLTQLSNLIRQRTVFQDGQDKLSSRDPLALWALMIGARLVAGFDDLNEDDRDSLGELVELLGRQLEDAPEAIFLKAQHLDAELMPGVVAGARPAAESADELRKNLQSVIANYQACLDARAFESQVVERLAKLYVLKIALPTDEEDAEQEDEQPKDPVEVALAELKELFGRYGNDRQQVIQPLIGRLVQEQANSGDSSGRKLAEGLLAWAAQKYPDWLKARVNAIKIQLQRRDAGAGEAVAKLLDDFPQNFAVWSLAFAKAREDGDTDAARALIDRLPAEAPAVARAEAYEAINDFETAREAYAALIATPGAANIEYRIAYAKSLGRTDLNAAKRELRKILQLDPKNADASRMLLTMVVADPQGIDTSQVEPLIQNLEANGETSGQRIRAAVHLFSGDTQLEKLRFCREAQGMLRDVIDDAEQLEPNDYLLLCKAHVNEGVLSQTTEPFEAAHSVMEELLDQPQAPNQFEGPYLTFLLQSIDGLGRMEKFGSNADAGALRSKYADEAMERVEELDREYASKEVGADLAQDEFARRLQVTSLGAKLLAIRGRNEDAVKRVQNFAAEHVGSIEGAAANAERGAAIANLFATLGAAEDSERWARQVAAVAPAARMLVYRALAMQQKSSAAIDQFFADIGDRAADLDINEASSLTMLMTALGEEAAGERSEAAIGRAVMRFGANAVFLTEVAVMRVSQGDEEQAIELLRKAIKVDPENVLALNNLATLMGERSDEREEALAHIENAIRIDGKKPALLDTKGTILLSMGRVEEAVEALESAVAVVDVDSRYYLHLAAAYKAAGKLELAYQAFSTAQRRGLEDAILTEGDQDLSRRLSEDLASRKAEEPLAKTTLVTANEE